MRVSELVLFHADPIFGPYAMQPETKFLRLRTPVTIGSRCDDWIVTWLGGWTRDRLSYIVMVVPGQALKRVQPGGYVRDR